MKHIEEYYQFWRCVTCPECKTENWLYDSHSQRHYPYIPSGCECFNCRNKFFVGSQDEFNVRFGNEIEDYGLDKTIDEYLDCAVGRSDPRN